MHLAFCIFKYFPFGGLQRNFLDIVQVLSGRGHHITVYTTQWDGEVPAGIVLKCVPVCKLTNHGKMRQFASAVRFLLRKEQFDAIIGFNKMPELDVYYAGDSCFEALTQRRYGERLGPFDWLRWLNPRYHSYRKMERAVFDPIARTHILTLSPTQEIEFQTHYRTQSSRFYMLPPSIKADRQSIGDLPQTRTRAREEIRISSGEVLLLMIGSCMKTKGLDRTLHAVSSMPSSIRSRCRVLAVGDDRAHGFTPLARRLGIKDRLRICGPRTDIPTFMAASDILLHPAYNDNTGTVLLEAMKYALPSLVTDVCGYSRYVIDANAGMVLPTPFKQTQFNEFLLEMLHSPNRHQWGMNGANFMKTLDCSSRAHQAAAIIESVARERVHARTTA
jgi:UDP-glucose:(heptosyl)LPS alpha-1,3-glucosyltransferase